MKLREIRTCNHHYFLDENNNCHGIYKSWYAEKQKCEHFHYEHGALQGEYKSWYDNGNLYKHLLYDLGLPHGECKSWFSNGQLNIHKFYEHGIDITEKALQYLDNDVMFTLVINIPRLPKS